MQRRTLLSVVGAGTLSLAGCTARPDTAGTDEGPNERTDVPDVCPTSQGLGVDWPEELDEATVETFVEAYEHAYYRDVVVAFEPESQLDSYELSGSVTDSPRDVGDGWELTYSGGGGVYRPTLLFGATPSDPPGGRDPVSVSEIDDEPLTEMLEAAAETGESEFHVDTPGEEVDRYLDLLTSLSEDFDGLSGPGDGGTIFVDVGGTTVELSVQATNFHGDYGWTARYHVTEQVVRRTTDEETAPRNGTVLECRIHE